MCSREYDFTFTPQSCNSQESLNMATKNITPAGSGAFPSYETIRKAQQPIRLSHNALRLQWTLEGHLSSAIRVMENKFYHPNAPTAPYGDMTTSSPKWSAVSQSPLTEPKVSSVTVNLEQLNDWEDTWLDFHCGHAEPDELCADNDEVRFGELSDISSDEDDEGADALLRCCGGNRPRKKKASLFIRASGEFITIHDFVSAVHPWALGLREDILQAAGDLQENIPLPADTRLMIDYPGPECVVFYPEVEWCKERSRRSRLEVRNREQLASFTAHMNLDAMKRISGSS